MSLIGRVTGRNQQHRMTSEEIQIALL